MKIKEAYQLWGVRGKTLTRLGAYNSLPKLRQAWVEHHAYPDAGRAEARVYIDDVNYSVVNDTMPLPVTTREFRSAEERDANIIANAEYFTAVRFLGVGKYERHEFPTRSEAVAKAQNLSKQFKGNYLIYAVNDRGYSAYVETVKWDK